MYIFGTAGHINHGKTSVVQALTGKDCDALADEKKRGITIELGFAHLATQTQQTIAFIDMPGHAKLLRTMAAGAAGVQGVLMVISAEAGVMPQTREHINVCQLLGITKGIIVLTHTDKVEDLEFATEFIKEELEDTFLHDAPLVCCCPPTGDGIPELKNTIEKILSSLVTPQSAPYTALPIDRIFSKEGFGTIITGSLVAGEISLDENLVLLPLGKASRVRRIQTQGKSVERVTAPARVAINLPDLEKKDLEKGNCLAKTHEIEAHHIFDAKLTWLPHNKKHLGRRRGLSLFIQGSQAMAHIQTLSPIEPGKEGMARIRCDRKVPLLPGGHFLLRGPMTAQWGGIVGGGLIVDAHPPLRRKRHTREALFNAENPIDIILEESGDTGLTPQEILSRIGQRHEGEKRYFHPIAVQKHKDNIASKLKSFHKKNPNEPGIASSMFRQTPIAEHVILQLIALKVVIQTGDAIHLATFIPPDEEGLKKEATLLLNYISSAKFTPETIKELYKNAPTGKFPINKTVQYLSSQKSIIKAGDFFITKEHLDRLSKMAATAVTHGEELAIQWLKERTGASRKHAIPIFEYLDRIGVTARNGNVRQAGPNVKEWT